MERGSCKRGRHAYGVPIGIGAGIVKRSCKYCGWLQIDLRSTETEPSEPGLFRTQERHSIFVIEQAISDARPGSKRTPER
jgi:hypothetical protein